MSLLLVLEAGYKTIEQWENEWIQEAPGQLEILQKSLESVVVFKISSVPTKDLNINPDVSTVFIASENIFCRVVTSEKLKTGLEKDFPKNHYTTKHINFAWMSGTKLGLLYEIAFNYFRNEDSEAVLGVMKNPYFLPTEQSSKLPIKSIVIS